MRRTLAWWVSVLACVVGLGCGDDDGGGGTDGGGRTDAAGGVDAGGTLDSGGGGDDSGGGVDAGGDARMVMACVVDPARMATYCTSFCAWEDMCSPGGAPCMTECYEDPNNFDDAALDMLAACFETLDCTGSGDRCITQVAMALGDARPADAAYGAACEMRDDECTSIGMGFGNDLCFGAPLLCSQAVVEMMECLELDCGMVSDCVIAAIRAG